MSAVVPDPSQALAGDLFSEADLSTGFQTDVVEDGEYMVALEARYNKKDGGIIFVQGKIQAGPHAGKSVKLFSAVLDGNTTKRANQKGIALTNLAACGLTTEILNQAARQVGAVAGNLEPLYEAVTEMLQGRIVAASLTQNTYTGKNGQVTEMQLAIGKATLQSAPQVAVAGVPQVAAPVAVAAPVPVAAAPAVAPPPVVAPPVAVAPPPPVAVAPAPAPVPVAAPAPAVAPAVAPAPAPVAAPAPAAVPTPVVEAPAPVPVAVAPVPVAVAPVAEVPAVAVAPATVSVAPEPSF